MSNTTQTGHLQPCGHPPSTYCDHCLFRTSDNTSDIVLVVEGQKLYFNKSLLSMCSPVFSRMFAGDFKEKEAEEVKLPGKTLKSMVLFFKQLHPVYAAVTPVTGTVTKAFHNLYLKYLIGKNPFFSSSSSSSFNPFHKEQWSKYGERNKELNNNKGYCSTDFFFFNVNQTKYES